MAIAFAPLNALSQSAARSLSFVGWPGVLGLGILVFTATFCITTLWPEQSELDTLREGMTKAQARATDTQPRATSPIERVATFYGLFPPAEHASDLLQKVFEAAELNSLKLEQGDYRVVKDNLGRLIQYQIALPVKGSYPQIRKFVAAAMTSTPSLALESIQIERQKVGEPVVEAKVKLVVYTKRRT